MPDEFIAITGLDRMHTSKVMLKTRRRQGRRGNGNAAENRHRHHRCWGTQQNCALRLWKKSTLLFGDYQPHP